MDDFSFDEDSSDALSPEQPASQESQGSAASPGEPKASDSPSPLTPNAAAAAQVQFTSAETESATRAVWSGTVEMGQSFTPSEHLLLQRSAWGSVSWVRVYELAPWLSRWQR